ncbi:uncharacterized protein LOC133332339 [Musca vetustissima]|uniref:uncharacterized protein LOC133332339 n=1 Tax=Musca vetustissima TaxID=27455 RepID=UPI002AB74D8B|nr:uncharacterized protein LOC133332339 [Musca vetustissima]
MKSSVFTLVAILAIVSTTIPSAHGLMEDAILEFLDELKMRMCHPIPKFGLPALDPLRIGHVEAEMDNKYIVDFTGSVTDLELTGLSDFEVTSLKITTTPLRRSNIEIVLPKAVLKTLYTAKGSIARVVNMNGDGEAEGYIQDGRVAISWIFSIGLSSVGIRSLTIEISLGGLWVNIEDIIEEPRINDFLHAVINELGIELLNDVWVEAQDMGAVKFVENKINGIMGAYSLTDLLKIIGGIVSGGGGEGGGPFDGIPPDCKQNIVAA